MSCVNWCNYTGTIRPDKDPESQLETWEVFLATFSNWFTNELLGVFSGETPTIPSQLYIAVNSTVCSRATQGTELSGDGYARTAISFERVSDIQRWNPADLYSPTASGEWSCLSFSLHDAPTGGNYYAYGNLAGTLTVPINKAILWPAKQVTVGIGSAL